MLRISLESRTQRRAQNRMDEARQAFREALEIYQRSAARDPLRFGPDVARVQRLLDELGN